MSWTTTDHAADLRVEVAAGSLPELFAEAVSAFHGVIGGGQTVETTATRELAATGEDLDEVWVRWWRGLLRAWTVEGLLPVRAEDVTADAAGARGVVRLAPAAALDPALCTDVKAVTWHRGGARQDADGWSGEIVLDV